jgi:hypothetical protein
MEPFKFSQQPALSWCNLESMVCYRGLFFLVLQAEWRFFFNFLALNQGQKNPALKTGER